MSEREGARVHASIRVVKNKKLASRLRCGLRKRVGVVESDGVVPMTRSDGLVTVAVRHDGMYDYLMPFEHCRMLVQEVDKALPSWIMFFEAGHVWDPRRVLWHMQAIKAYTQNKTHTGYTAMVSPWCACRTSKREAPEPKNAECVERMLNSGEYSVCRNTCIDDSFYLQYVVHSGALREFFKSTPGLIVGDLKFRAFLATHCDVVASNYNPEPAARWPWLYFDKQVLEIEDFEFKN